MDRDLLAHFPVVLAVARRRSFVAAAAELGMGASAVSHAVRTVEDRIGVPLFARTTRSVALTQAGEALLGSIAGAFAEVEQAVGRVRAERGVVSGVLRLNAPRVALPIAVTPVLVELTRRHPELTVEVTCDDALVDIVSGGFDAGIRVGEMIAGDMVAVRLTSPYRMILVASPDYVAARGDVESVHDLAQHNCIGYRMAASGGVYAWELLDHGRDVAVGVRGTVMVTDATYARDLALAGVGIAYMFAPLVRADLEAQRLVWLLPEAAITEPGLFVYFPRRSGRLPGLRAFLDVAKDVLRQANTAV